MMLPSLKCTNSPRNQPSVYSTSNKVKATQVLPDVIRPVFSPAKLSQEFVRKVNPFQATSPARSLL